MSQMRCVLTPLAARLTTSLNVSCPSMQVHSMARSEMSTWMTTPSTRATRFIASRTRHAPEPPASSRRPVRQMMVDLSASGASTASSSPSRTTSCQAACIWCGRILTP